MEKFFKKGKIVFFDGTVFEGDWVDNKLEGFGVLELRKKNFNKKKIHWKDIILSKDIIKKNFDKENLDKKSLGNETEKENSETNQIKENTEKLAENINEKISQSELENNSKEKLPQNELENNLKEKLPQNKLENSMEKLSQNELENSEEKLSQNELENLEEKLLKNCKDENLKIFKGEFRNSIYNTEIQKELVLEKEKKKKIKDYKEGVKNLIINFSESLKLEKKEMTKIVRNFFSFYKKEEISKFYKGNLIKFEKHKPDIWYFKKGKSFGNYFGKF